MWRRSNVRSTYPPHEAGFFVFMSKETQSIFGKGKRESSIAYHNVYHVLPRADENTARHVRNHYGKRAGAMDYGAREIGALIHEPTQEHTKQAAYLQELVGRPFRVITPEELQKREKNSTLVVPYINMSVTENEIKQCNQETWGLPSQLIELIKNKALFHRLIEESSVEGFATPEFQIANKANVDEKAMKVLHKAEKMYDEANMPEYPRGVIIRSDHSDGNYGMAMIKQNHNHIYVALDGKPDYAQTFGVTDWESAVACAKTHLQTAVEGDDTEFVVSRLIDRGDEPGLSLIITDGEVSSMGWNKQLLAEQSTACIGTSDYDTAIKEFSRDRSSETGRNPQEIFNEKKNIQSQLQDKTAADFETFLREVCVKNDIDFATISGAVNVDIMLPGPMEKELRRRQGKKAGYYVAESNPRWTNYTDAIMLAVGANHMEPTVANMKAIRDRGITSVDGYTSEKVGNLDVLRNELLIVTADHREQEIPEMPILRMPDNPPGVVFVGDLPKGKELYKKAALKAV